MVEASRVGPSGPEVWSPGASGEDIVCSLRKRRAVPQVGDGATLARSREHPRWNNQGAFGSILRVRITGVTDDLNDYTMRVHNGVLKLLGGDYDGSDLHCRR